MQKKTPDILKKILDYKIEYIDYKKREISLEELKHRSDDSPQRRGFTNSLIKKEGTNCYLSVNSKQL